MKGRVTQVNTCTDVFKKKPNILKKYIIYTYKKKEVKFLKKQFSKTKIDHSTIDII